MRARQVWVMSGSKRFITNGGGRPVHRLRAHGRRRQGPDQRLHRHARPSGVSTGKEEEKLGLKGSSTTDLYLEKVRCRRTTFSASQGAASSTPWRSERRRVSLAAGAVGGAKEMIDQAVKYARERRSSSGRSRSSR